MFQTIDILKELVGIPSYVDSDHNEKGVIDYVERFIKANTKYKYVTQTVEGERKNILVYNKPNPKIALFGHMDTVLPKAETDMPFDPKIVDDRLFGLGSVDMKSGLAIMLKLATEIENDDLSFVFSVDEEYDFKGAIKLKEIRNFRPEFVINVEPTDNSILNGCRGITEFSLAVHGRSSHAGRKESGINAIEKAVQLVEKFQKEMTKMDKADGGKTSVNLAYLHGGMQRETKKGKSEITGMGNVVPNYAELICEIRIADPAITSSYVQSLLSKLADDLDVTISNFKTKFYLGAMMTPKTDLLEFEKSVTDSNEEVSYADISLAGYYEVQMLQESWGSKSMVYGPGPINLSHAANEYVELASIEKAEKVLRNFILNKIK